jgi:hypothetical protein
LNDAPAIKANSPECELKKYGSLYFYKKKIWWVSKHNKCNQRDGKPWHDERGMVHGVETK